MARKETPADVGQSALAAWRAGTASGAQIRTAVRYTLEALSQQSPGGSVEVRVPPAGVTQAIAGPRHTRGTPPNTIEMAPEVWLGLVTGACTWTEEVEAGRVRASGVRADLSGELPLRGI